jgi:hypothetical protein
LFPSLLVETRSSETDGHRQGEEKKYLPPPLEIEPRLDRWKEQRTKKRRRRRRHEKMTYRRSERV